MLAFTRIWKVQKNHTKIINLKYRKTKITKDKNGETVPHLKIIEVFLIHCNIVDNDYQKKSIVFYTFIPNKSFGQLLDIPPKSFTFLKTFDSEFPYIEVWFTDQDSKPLNIATSFLII